MRENRFCSACHTEMHQGLFAGFLLTSVLHRDMDLTISFSDAQAEAKAGIVDAGFPGLQRAGFTGASSREKEYRENLCDLYHS